MPKKLAALEFFNHCRRSLYDIIGSIPTLTSDTSRANFDWLAVLSV
jgi:hypothetical protein